MVIMGFYRQTRKQVKVDYSKWLGKDYKYTYDGAGIYICNHNSPFELMLMLFTMPRYVTFLGKEECRDWPLLGKIIDPF